jgi:hypothetical protein
MNIRLNKSNYPETKMKDVNYGDLFTFKDSSAVYMIVYNSDGRMSVINLIDAKVIPYPVWDSIVIPLKQDTDLVVSEKTSILDDMPF